MDFEQGTVSDSTPLLQSIRKYSSINPISEEAEISFSNYGINSNIFKNSQCVKVKNCSSVASAITKISTSSISVPNSFLCIKFKVDDKFYDPDETEFLRLANYFKKFSSSVCISFQSTSDRSILIFWKVKENFQIFSLAIVEHPLEFRKFVLNSLISSLKSGHTGILPFAKYSKYRIRVEVSYDMLGDFRGFDLLFLAVEAANHGLVQILSSICDIKYSVEGKTAADIAYENDNYEILLILLKSNSRFPSNFDKMSNDLSLPIGLRKFLLVSNSMHEAIRNNNKTEVLHIIQENPGLKFFYNISNESALSVAIRAESCEIYKIMIDKNLSLGPHEILNNLLEGLNDSKKKDLCNIHEEKFQRIAEKHILILMSNTNVGPDDTEHQNRLALVAQAYLKLNTVPKIKKILKIVAATRNFQVTFDFKREHVQYLHPRAEDKTSGLFYLNGKIYIGAMHLLNNSRANEVLGVIAHEFCHFAMFKIFDNFAIPYKEDDIISEKSFDVVIERCKELNGITQIIDSVFDYYYDEEYPQELIVRIPHILGHYIDQPEKVKELEDIFTELNRFFNEECIPVMNNMLPILEKEGEDRIRLEHIKPSSIFKKYWGWILGFLCGSIFLLLFLLFMFYPCLFKNCGTDLYAKCVNKKVFHAECQCHNDLVWNSGKCFNCIEDGDCVEINKSCFEFNCIDNENLFFCQDKLKKIKLKMRCDGKKDCYDGSDETYHCIYAHCSRIGVLYPPNNVIINDSDYMVTTSETRCKVSAFKMDKNINAHYLPVNLEFLSGLNEYFVKKCSIKRVFVKNFANLTEITKVNLNYNLIETIEPGSFHSLRNLDRFSLAGNRITKIGTNFFSNIKTIRFINFSENNISNIPTDLFENLPHLTNIDFRNCKIVKLEKNLLNKNNQLYEVVFLNNSIRHIDLTNWSRFKQAYYVDFSNNKCIDRCYSNDTCGRYSNCYSIKSDLTRDLLNCE